VLGAGITDVADEDPNLFMLMMVTACAFLGVVLAGFILVIILFLALSAFVGAGLIGISLFTALRARSLRKGFRTLCTLSGAICGIPLILVTGFLAGRLFDLNLTTTDWLGILAAGTAGGAFIGWVFFRTSQLLLRALGRRINTGSPA